MVATGSQEDLRALLRRLWHHMTRRRRRQSVLVAGLTLVSALADVVTLGAVIPFLGILTDPERVFANPAVQDLAGALGIETADEMVLPLTVAFAAAAVIAGATRILLLWVSSRLAFAIGADLGIEAYHRTLYQPYAVHVARNSSEVISGITTKVHGVVVEVIRPLLNLASSVVLFVAVTVALLVIDPVVASLAIVGFGTSYAGISYLSRRRLLRESERVAHEQTQVVKALQEGLGGIRDVLLDGTQPVYADIYSRADRPMRRAQASITFTAAYPRFAMEAGGMVLIAALAFGISRQAGGVTSALPVLGALALGAQRLLPAMQLAYSAWASLTGYQASLRDIIELLDQPLPNELLGDPPEPLDFRESIAFDAVRFRYSDDGPWVLDGVDLTIPRGAQVGVVGVTGSGKSTLLDVLMGLLTPTDGKLLVDGEPLKGTRRRAWQRAIAHVPQSIYLADTTFAENIAFGVPPDQIDMDRVRRVARQAHIADFIEAQPAGYDTKVGERGIRLSGGQRQRIGITRALYKQASVLIFDEATSALDNATEQTIMASIHGLDPDLTILLVAHRLTTVEQSDFVVMLDGSRVVAQGTYEELLRSSATFRHMAHAPQ